MFKRKKNHRYQAIGVLDIGTTRVSCLIARGTGENIEVIGCGQNMMQGVKRGILVDMEAAARAIVQAIQAAENQAEERIQKIYVGLPATVVQSEIVVMQVSLSLEEPVHAESIQQLYRQLQERAQEKGLEIIHAIPISYQLDDQKGIQDPRGMYGERLIAKMHVLGVSVAILRNFYACIHGCHLDVAGVVIVSYVAALVALTEDEMDLGVVFIDMGGGSTTLIAYGGGGPVLFKSLPIGGQHITQDIARILQTNLMQAERLKTLYGSALSATHEEREMIAVPQVDGDFLQETMSIPKGRLNKVIQARLEEITSSLSQKLIEGGAAAWQGRIVLAGGATQLGGMREFLQGRFGKSVRFASVRSSGLEEIASGAAEMFLPCVGILKFVTQDEGPAGKKEAPRQIIWHHFKKMLGHS